MQHVWRRGCDEACLPARSTRTPRVSARERRGLGDSRPCSSRAAELRKLRSCTKMTPLIARNTPRARSYTGRALRRPRARQSEDDCRRRRSSGSSGSRVVVVVVVAVPRSRGLLTPPGAKLGCCASGYCTSFTSALHPRSAPPLSNLAVVLYQVHQRLPHPVSPTTATRTTQTLGSQRRHDGEERAVRPPPARLPARAFLPFPAWSVTLPGIYSYSTSDC